MNSSNVCSLEQQTNPSIYAERVSDYYADMETVNLLLNGHC